MLNLTREELVVLTVILAEYIKLTKQHKTEWEIEIIDLALKPILLKVEAEISQIDKKAG